MAITELGSGSPASVDRPRDDETEADAMGRGPPAEQRYRRSGHENEVLRVDQCRAPAVPMVGEAVVPQF